MYGKRTRITPHTSVTIAEKRGTRPRSAAKRKARAGAKGSTGVDDGDAEDAGDEAAGDLGDLDLCGVEDVLDVLPPGLVDLDTFDPWAKCLDASPRPTSGDWSRKDVGETWHRLVAFAIVAQVCIGRNSSRRVSVCVCV